METWMKLGAVVMVHGINKNYVGQIVEILPGKVVRLQDASWVAETGRLHEFIKHGKTDDMEIEPVGDHLMEWTEITHWPHKLFKEAI